MQVTRIFIIVLMLPFQTAGIFSQEKVVVNIAKQFCHATNDFFYFTNDETLKTKTTLDLSKIFDYQDGTYFTSTGIKTILILPKDSIESSLQKATRFFEQSGTYTIYVNGKFKSIIKEGKTVYRFYPYKNAIVFETFN